MTARSIPALVVLAACGHPPPARPPPAPAEERAAIVASEIGVSGARIVAIDEHGDRRFVATREGGDFDLWRLAVRDGRAAGDPVQLTHDETQEVTPTVARDGTVIYM